jgi:type 1 fimbria pilin
MFLLFVSFVAQSACRIGGDGKNDDTITLDATFDLSNKLLSVSQEQNLAFTKSFSCVWPNEKMYFTDNIADNIYSLGASNGLKFSIKGISTNFPVNVGGKDNNVSTINKPITLVFDYIKNGGAAVKNFENNSFIIDKAFTVSSQQCLKLFGGCVWGSDASQFYVNLNVTVINKKTTCEFVSPSYEISMETVTVQELISGEKKRSSLTNIKLACDGVHNIASNPVVVKLSSGDWDAEGKKLVNSIQNGSKNVGFEIFNGSSTISLSKGDSLLTVAKLSTISDKYIFPISAEYTLMNDERPTPGLVSSKVILSVDYQ